MALGLCGLGLVNHVGYDVQALFWLLHCCKDRTAVLLLLCCCGSAVLLCPVARYKDALRQNCLLLNEEGQALTRVPVASTTFAVLCDRSATHWFKFEHVAYTRDINLNKTRMGGGRDCFHGSTCATAMAYCYSHR
jgi:hypothetical protein